MKIKMLFTVLALSAIVFTSCDDGKKKEQAEKERMEQMEAEKEAEMQDEERVYEIADETPGIEDKLIKEQNLEQLLADIKQLKPHYQQVINLRFFQEKSYKEIAAILDEPMNNIKVKLLRAKKLLAEIIELRNS